MLEIKLSGICEGCPLSELNLDYTEIGIYGEKTRTWTVKCEHEKICAIWHKKITNLTSIIRCRDCIHYIDDYCRRFGDDFGLDFYCKFGENKEERK